MWGTGLHHSHSCPITSAMLTVPPHLHDPKEPLILRSTKWRRGVSNLKRVSIKNKNNFKIHTVCQALWKNKQKTVR